MKLRFILFGSLLLFTVFLLGCNKTRVVNEQAVNYVMVNNAKSENETVFYGLVKSQFESELSFQTEGRIEFIPYMKGDFVKKGQVLARLDGILYKIKKDEEEARLKDAILQLNKSQSYYKRMNILHEKGAISDNDWEDAYYGYHNNQQLVKIQQEKIRYLEKEINYNILVAPYDGFISEKLAEVGSYAKIGSPVLVINSSQKTLVEVVADSGIVNNLDINKNITVERNGIKYQGKIAHISKTSKDEGGYLIKIELDKLYNELKDGMSISAYIPNKDSSIVTVPLDSIFEKNSEKYVFKVTNIKNNFGTIQKEKVTTKDIVNEEIEITKGVNIGDIIISKDPDKYTCGSKVKL